MPLRLYYSVFNALCSMFLGLALLAGLTLTYALPLDDANAADFYYPGSYKWRTDSFRACSRTKLSKNVLREDSPRRAHDGNLSHFHAYLSCVWWSGGPDAPSDKEDYPFYNSQCADIYRCVHRNRLKKKKSALLYADRFDRTCGLNIMDLILARKNHVGNDGQKAPLADICQAKIKNPIEIICPGTIEYNREWEEDHGRSYQQPPNPCAPGSESFYLPYMIRSKAEMRQQSVTAP